MKQHRSQQIGKFFGSMPSWVLFLLILVCSLLLVGAGVLVGQLRFRSGISIPESPLGTAVGAVLGLLAFMLGFTFSLTWTRFANRNNLVLSQAKALSTSYLRTRLIPEKQKQETRKLFTEYTQLMLDMQTTSLFDQSLARLEELELLIWQQTASLVQEDVDSEVRSLFISSVNEVINISAERKTVALVFRIPDAIWESLLLLAALGMFAFGYLMGISGIRKVFELPLLPIAFGLVIVLIANMNTTGQQRGFSVLQNPLSDVLDLMKKDLP